jgi:leucyl aminopeptidase (aminopeptidase T)
MDNTDEGSSRFSDIAPTSDSLRRAAGIAVKDSLKVQAGEKVLIITNPVKSVLDIAHAVYDACVEAHSLPTMIVQGVKKQTDCAEDVVITAFDSQPDVVISLSANKMGKDKDGIRTPYEWDGTFYDHIFHYQLYGARTLRAFWSPSVNASIFENTVPIDYQLLKRRCARLKETLDKAVRVRVTNPLGTDIEIGVSGREALCDDGDFAAPGKGGNLPAGEVFVSPVVGDSDGIIVFDGSISVNEGDIVIRTPIRATVKNGFVTDISGGEEAARLLRTVEGAERESLKLEAEGNLPRGKGEFYARNARNLGELGIGLNPNAVIVGNMLQDEKAFGTCHFAIGHNYNADASALIHLDGLVTKPTIVAIMPGGSQVVIEKDGVLQE